MNSGMEGGHHEFDEPASELARTELLMELYPLRDFARASDSMKGIAGDPVLHALSYKLIEAGQGLDPGLRAHLRKMIAFRIHANGGLDEFVQRTGYPQEVFDTIEYLVADELIDLEMAQEELPVTPRRQWQVAEEDIERLELG